MSYLYRASGRLGPLRASLAAQPQAQRLAAVRLFAADPTIDLSRLHMRTMMIANTLPTQINTQFTPDALQRVCDMAAGAAVMRNHATYQAADMPVARVVSAAVEPGPGGPWAAFDFAWPQTAAGDEMAALIDSGVWRESSLGWTVNGASCSVCAQDLFSEDCPHLAGEVYDGTKCLAVMNADSIEAVDEASLVWKGAAQGTFMVQRPEPDMTDPSQPMPMETALSAKAQRFTAGAIPFHDYPLAPDDEPWDAAAEFAKADTPQARRAICAWVDSANKDQLTAYKFPYCHADPHQLSRRGAANGLARLSNSSIPEADKAAVKRVLERAMEKFHQRDQKNAMHPLSIFVPRPADVSGLEQWFAGT